MRAISGKNLLIFLFACSFFFLVFGAYQLTHETRYFPIKFVRVYGARHVDHQELQKLLAPLLVHNFFSVDMELIRDRLRQFPWVEDIAIRRVWPDSVHIVVTERIPVAFWHDGSLLSSNGDLFNHGGYQHSPDLPELIGPDGSQTSMLQYFNDFKRELMPLHAKIVQLEMTPYQIWQLKLNNGIRLRMGDKNTLTRFKQFVKVYPKIIGNKAKDVDYIDLRYSNGMAIRWKDGNHRK